MNAIVKVGNVPTPLLSKSLGRQELDENRARIGFELEVLAKKYDRFGWERDRGTAAHDRLFQDWMDSLQDYPWEEVQTACRRWIEKNPNKCPNEGHIKAIILAERRHAIAFAPRAIPVAPPKEPKSKANKARMQKYAEEYFSSIKRVDVADD